MILLDEYEQSRGNQSIFAFWASTVFAMSYSRVLMVIFEIIIYVIFFGHIGHQYWIVSYRWQILWVDGTSGPTRQCSGVGSVPRSSILPSC